MAGKRKPATAEEVISFFEDSDPAVAVTILALCKRAVDNRTPSKSQRTRKRPEPVEKPAA